jgi:methylenetetrahydrofolate--tRNA-(uracil-5-)-methyltransferase
LPHKIKIIGAGLAGTEAAWQLASSGLDLEIELWEMRPKVKTPAHHTDNFAELVCSNSLGSEFLTTARGLLIREMEHFDSLIIKAAKDAKVPAGQALAVDRDLFAKYITDKLESHPSIKIIREEFDQEIIDNNDEAIIIATGPLTSAKLSKRIQEFLMKTNPEAKSSYLHFFDAAAPIITAESINMDIAFKASRYDKGDGADYINCPFYNKNDFDNFYQALIQAKRAPLKDFEKENMRYFEGCMPIEAIAERGQKTLTFGPMKPVGLKDPRRPNDRAYAVVQLRQDNVVGSLYNLVGFQTNLEWGEQKKVFALIPGLENLEIVRYGVMHQNIFINSPLFLDSNFRVKQSSNIFFAGQVTGVEGYTESAASGLMAARSLIAQIKKTNFDLPRSTMMGALSHYISSCEPKYFQPINSNWGIINYEPEALEMKYRKNKTLKNEFLANRALEALNS